MKLIIIDSVKYILFLVTVLLLFLPFFLNKAIFVLNLVSPFVVVSYQCLTR